jgi:hypothetical protein
MKNKNKPYGIFNPKTNKWVSEFGPDVRWTKYADKAWGIHALNAFGEYFDINFVNEVINSPRNPSLTKHGCIAKEIL